MSNHESSSRSEPKPQPSAPGGGSVPAVGRLALASGEVFTGTAFGATGQSLCVASEVVFNTAMTGYQESLTDPSYTGQILTMTTALVGNTGANPGDMESERVGVSGMVVNELARSHSNYRAGESLGDLLSRSGVLGLAGVDTRALTRRLRSGGVVNGAITDDPSITDADLVDRARNAPSMAGQNLVTRVATERSHAWTGDLGEWLSHRLTSGSRGRADSWKDGGPTVLAIDCGAKHQILRHLTDRGCRVLVIPPSTPASEVRAAFERGEAQGLFISNGPGDPDAVRELVGTLREVIDAQPAMPIFGICLGHQLLALASGARTFKLPFGHRGANQPVKELETGRVEITSQNHGFAVEPDSLDPQTTQITHLHLNDGTVAGFRRKDRPVFSVQYHPEASPGPHDASVLFDRFVGMLGEGQPASVGTAR